ncbi:hypothetical protein VNO77_27811 [Canavalia gladiata]|uniref:Uncharacterized protein n=1 Tax=Canavalia gladiata TaxID=3824 RepID=A0AAN9KYI8_CANGL
MCAKERLVVWCTRLHRIPFNNNGHRICKVPVSVGEILIETLQGSLVGSTNVERGHKIAAFHERWTLVAFGAL